MKQTILIVLMCLVFSASYGQKFISSHAVGDQMKSYDKILVVAKAKGDGERSQTEDDMVKYLKKKGINAEPSYVRLPSSMLKNGEIDEKMVETFVSKLKNDGIDGILVTSLVSSANTVEHNPSSYHASTVPVRYGRFGRYYTTAWVGVYEPSSTEKHSVFVLESLLYDLDAPNKDKSLHWIGKIRVTDPSSYDKASDKYAKSVVKKLTKEAIKK